MTTRRPLSVIIALALAMLLALPTAGLAASDSAASDRPAPDTATDRRPTDRYATDRVTDRVTDRRLDTRTETFQIGRIGVVAITWARTGIVDVDVRARRGWRHETTRNGRNTVRVVFANGEVAAVFTAHLTPDGTLRTALHRRDLDGDERARPGTWHVRAARSATTLR